MNLIRQEDDGCVAASVAMLFGLDTEAVETHSLFNPRFHLYPFPLPWDICPKVASMDEVCDWAYKEYKVGLVTFSKNPGCSAALECPVVPVWKDGEAKFLEHLSYGEGLLEGHVENMKGHMCAWDGKTIYDPRGYVYSFDDSGAYDFTAVRFWLKVQGE